MPKYQGINSGWFAVEVEAEDREDAYEKMFELSCKMRDATTSFGRVVADGWQGFAIDEQFEE